MEQSNPQEKTEVVIPDVAWVIIEPFFWNRLWQCRRKHRL